MPADGSRSRPDSSLRAPRWLRPAAAFLLFAVLAWWMARAAYPSMFSSFAYYDDEGFVLLSLREFLSGGGLYNDVYSHYGPFYYEFWGVVFKPFGIDVTTDAGRIATLVVWVATASLSGLVSYLLTRSLVICAAVQVLAFSALITLVVEPAHPSGLICLLLIVIAVVGSLFRRDRAGSSVAAALGALLGGLVLVKANVGAFALLSTLLAIASVWPAISRAWARRAIEVLFVALPFLLVAQTLSDGSSRAFAFHVSIAALAVVVSLRPAAPEPARLPAELRWLAAGFAAAVVAVLGLIVVLGTTPSGLLDGLLLQPLKQTDVLRIATSLPTEVLVLDVAILGLCVALRRAAREPEGSNAALAVPIARILAGIALALMVGGVLEPLEGGGTTELATLSLAGIAAIPSRLSPPGMRSVFGLRLLPALAVLQALHAYPVASSQITWATFLLLPLAGLCVGLGISELLAARSFGNLASAAPTVALVVVVALLVQQVLIDRHRQESSAFDAGVPLDLPGAERLRLPAAQAETLRDVSESLRRHCDTFVGFPGLDSFYLWNELDPPNALNVNDWMYLFDEGEQQRVVDAAERSDRLCVLRYPPADAIYKRNGYYPDGPLLRFVRGDFDPAERFDGYAILVRSDQGPEASRR